MYTIETTMGGNTIKVTAPNIPEVLRLYDAMDRERKECTKAEAVHLEAVGLWAGKKVLVEAGLSPRESRLLKDRLNGKAVFYGL